MEKSKNVEIESDVQELKEVLQVVTKEIPTLIRSIIEPLKELLNEYLSPEAGKKRAQMVAAVYKELVESGIPREEALEIAKSQLVDVNTILKSIFSSLSSISRLERIRQSEEQ